MQNWEGKIELALWFESNGVTYQSPYQFYEINIERGELALIRQMTEVEFKYLTREKPA